MADTGDVTSGSSTGWRRLGSEIRSPFRKKVIVGAWEPPPSSPELSREQERNWWEAYVENRVAAERSLGVIGGLVAGATLVGTYHSGWLTFGSVLAFWVGAWYLHFYGTGNRFWTIIAWVLMAPVLAVIALVAVGQSCSGAGS